MTAFLSGEKQVRLRVSFIVNFLPAYYFLVIKWAGIISPCP